MKTSSKFFGLLLLLTPLVVNAAPILIVGTPGDDLLSTPTGPSPILGGPLLTFSTLTQFSTFTSYSSQGITVSSPDGLEVLPYSTQSNPNYLYDLGTGGNGDGTADITVGFKTGTSAIGVGIADSDNPANIVLQALGSNGADLGSAFNVTQILYNSASTVNPGNSYFVVQDSSPDIFGLVITQSVSSSLNSGLAIADVQVAPEPSSFLLLIGGAAMMGYLRLRSRA